MTEATKNKTFEEYLADAVKAGEMTVGQARNQVFAKENPDKVKAVREKKVPSTEFSCVVKPPEGTYPAVLNIQPAGVGPTGKRHKPKYIPTRFVTAILDNPKLIKAALAEAAKLDAAEADK